MVPLLFSELKIKDHACMYMYEYIQIIYTYSVHVHVNCKLLYMLTFVRAHNVTVH